MTYKDMHHTLEDMYIFYYFNYNDVHIFHVIKKKLDFDYFTFVNSLIFMQSNILFMSFSTAILHTSNAHVKFMSRFFFSSTYYNCINSLNLNCNDPWICIANSQQIFTNANIETENSVFFVSVHQPKICENVHKLPKMNIISTNCG